MKTHTHDLMIMKQNENAILVLNGKHDFFS